MTTIDEPWTTHSATFGTKVPRSNLANTVAANIRPKLAGVGQGWINSEVAPEGTVRVGSGGLR